MQPAMQRDLNEIPKSWATEFQRQVVESYMQLCSFYAKMEPKSMPSEMLLADDLMIWCHEASSLAEFSDPQYYRTLADDERYEMFYQKTLADRYVPFTKDIMTMAERERLSLWVFHQKRFINFPVTEVW